MSSDRRADRTSRDIRERQQEAERDEFRTAARSLLMTPLMSPTHQDFTVVRRHAGPLRDWFARETGWILHVEREGARLYKRPADLTDATRGLPGYGRGRYVLLCLACAVLERADPQITLHLLGDRVLKLSVDPVLAGCGYSFTLGTQNERRDLVAVCRTLLDLGVLQRVAGDEESFVQAGRDHGDALYDVHRRALAGMLAAVRGPSTWAAGDAPATLDERLHALADEHVADSEEARRTALRHRIARQLLDDPVIYVECLEPQTRAYFVNQRGAMAARLCEATGLMPEQRAEGLALTDETGSLTDVAMPAEGTDAHVTLLVAEYLARRAKDGHRAFEALPEQDIAHFLGEARERFGRYWRRSAREPGSERELAAIAIERLEKLRLVARDANGVQARPALVRFALGEADIQLFGDARRSHDAPGLKTP
ncbi:TIGR02678 family protein [Blastochloris sulfoviridis]|uniref:TIGR02678 family protein n=1 Tax=Blastochloris sulfoviridis TaxID=50712 RepID=A0A5M6I3K2_9HYPH|nr:TIGR02678 family protein [Blastochloris sulfoviridis]KAA5602375.1 TIGR02678 family protein [Blastochloris sulfoviridis]